MKRLLSSTFAAWLLFAASVCPADESRRVIAHYMTDMVPRTDGRLSRWIDPELSDPEGSTAALGGLHQTVPMASLYLKKADLCTAVEFEIRAARQLGIDGFQFYYPLVDNTRLLENYNQIIREFLRQSEERFPGFKVSLCLCHCRSAACQERRREDRFVEPAGQCTAGRKMQLPSLAQGAVRKAAFLSLGRRCTGRRDSRSGEHTGRSPPTSGAIIVSRRRSECPLSLRIRSDDPKSIRRISPPSW